MAATLPMLKAATPRDKAVKAVRVLRRDMGASFDLRAVRPVRLASMSNTMEQNGSGRLCGRALDPILSHPKTERTACRREERHAVRIRGYMERLSSCWLCLE